MAMKFRAHDTFFIRKGWLSKGMKYVQKKPDVFVAKDENPMSKNRNVKVKLKESSRKNCPDISSLTAKESRR